MTTDAGRPREWRSRPEQFTPFRYFTLEGGPARFAEAEVPEFLELCEIAGRRLCPQRSFCDAGRPESAVVWLSTVFELAFAGRLGAKHRAEKQLWRFSHAEIHGQQVARPSENMIAIDADATWPAVDAQYFWEPSAEVLRMLFQGAPTESIGETGDPSWRPSTASPERDWAGLLWHTYSGHISNVVAASRQAIEEIVDGDAKRLRTAAGRASPADDEGAQGMTWGELVARAMQEPALETYIRSKGGPAAVLPLGSARDALRRYLARKGFCKCIDQRGWFWLRS